MSYNKSPKSVERVRYLLDELVKENKTTEWIFERPSKVIYHIYEAVRYAISSGKKEYEKYTIILNRYKFKVIEPDIVRAEFKNITPNGIVIRGINDVVNVIGRVIESKQSKIVFPDFKYGKEDDDDVEILTEWCNRNSYKYYIDEQLRLTLERI